MKSIKKTPQRVFESKANAPADNLLEWETDTDQVIQQGAWTFRAPIQLLMRFFYVGEQIIMCGSNQALEAFCLFEQTKIKLKGYDVASDTKTRRDRCMIGNSFS